MLDTILLVDQEEVTIGLSRALEMGGYRVSTADCVAVAVAKLRDTYGLLIVDPHILCDPSSEEPRNKIQTLMRDAKSRMPVWVLSGDSEWTLNQDYRIVEGTHYDRYSRKPLFERDILPIVKEMLQPFAPTN